MAEDADAASPEDEDDVCPICLDVLSAKKVAVLRPCRHRFCASCAVHAVRPRPAGTHMACALCRQPICAIEGLVGDRVPADAVLDVGHGRFAGVTLVNHRHGVQVSRFLNRKDEGARVLRRHDVITHLNGIRSTDHRTSVALVNACTVHGIPVHVTRRQVRWWRW